LAITCLSLRLTYLFFFSQNFFSEPQVSESSEDEAQPSDKALPTASRLPNPLAAGLPSPALGSMLKEGTVFGNKFVEQERAKQAILEKHVKMTEDKTSKRPPCFKFKKGECKKGLNCRYSHELSFQAPKYQTQETTDSHDDGISTESPAAPKSKRAGVTNTLYPAKKAKGSLDHQRAQERPWTVNR